MALSLPGTPTAVKRDVSLCDLDLLSALGGIRTPNLLIRSQMLYPLSYERKGPIIGSYLTLMVS